jgi:hypothetical protein
MRTRLSRLVWSIAIALAIPMATMGATTPVAVYHGTWDTAHWAGSPDTCFFVFLGDVQASGNWNVTILPGGKQAIVHINMFTTTVDPQSEEPFRVHVDAWGGRALGGTWTVDSLSPDGFALHLDLTGTSMASWNTFVLDDGTLTFTIAPWAVPGVASCDAAIADGLQR